MRKKIICIFVMMLFIATALTSIVTGVKINNEQNKPSIGNAPLLMDNDILWCPEGAERSWIQWARWPDDPYRPICMWVNLEELPDFLTYEPNPSSGVGETNSTITATPDYCEAGEYPFIVYVAESCYGEPHWEFPKTLIVNNTNRPPTIELDPSGTITVLAGETIHIDVIGHDPDVDECEDDFLTYSCSDPDHFFTPPYGNPYYEWETTIEDVGDYDVTFSVEDLLDVLIEDGVVLKILAGEQPPWNHSTLATEDGSIRDDDLAEYICEQIPKKDGVPQVKDVKIMCAQCYGGGMKDDFERVFGPDGDCAGVPWVFGSSCNWDEPAEGWGDETVNHANHKAKKLGSCWTDALANSNAFSTTRAGKGSIRDRTTDNVKADFEAARNNDDSGPNYDNNEDPQVAWGNGGQNIEWDADNTWHRALVFGGDQTDARHHNNVDNVAEALDEIWDDDKSEIKKIDGGTTKELKDAIKEVCKDLNTSTQLVLYFNDHGNTRHNESEFQQWIDKIIEDYYESLFELHDGWEEGFQDNYQQGDEPSPYICVGLMEAIEGENWNIQLNDESISIPSGTHYGTLNLPVDWTIINSEENHLEIIGNGEEYMHLNGLELCSGHINDIEKSDGNSKPNKPLKPSGPTSGKINTKYTYTTSTTDPDGDQVYLLFNWGDESDSGWIGPQNSGTIFSATHSWAKQGRYVIRAKAKDIHGAESEWSDPLPIEMPRYRVIYIPLLRFLQNYPILYQLFQRFLKL